MNHITSNTTNYLKTLEDIKQRVKTAQIKAHLSVNKEMLILYWQIGNTILDRQEQEGWGTKITQKLSEDLKKEFPNMKGFSYTNLRYMQRFAKTYKNLLICHQAEGKLKNSSQIFYAQYANIILGIPWRHNTEIIDKVKDKSKRLWYAKQTIKHGWSRSVLEYQIRVNLYDKQAIKEIKTNNFEITLPNQTSDLAREIFKDEYNLEFVENSQGDLKERQLENALIDDIIKFLTELGKGFAFVGKQYHLEVDDEDLYIDLLFYHLELKCYIVIDLKTTKFKAEYAGKMALYLAEVDENLKKETDNYSIGVILCPNSQNSQKAQKVVNYITKPMSVAGYKLANNRQEIPKELKPLEDLKKLI